MCRSRRELSNEYLLAKISVDTAENEPLEVWGKYSISFNSSFIPERRRKKTSNLTKSHFVSRLERGLSPLSYRECMLGATWAEQKRHWKCYTLTNDAGQMYVGIEPQTKDLRRYADHDFLGHGPVSVFDADKIFGTFYDARMVEQIVTIRLMKKHGVAQVRGAGFPGKLMKKDEKEECESLCRLSEEDLVRDLKEMQEMGIEGVKKKRSFQATRGHLLLRCWNCQRAGNLIPFEDQFGHMRGSAECGVVQMKKESDERERREKQKRGEQAVEEQRQTREILALASEAAKVASEAAKAEREAKKRQRIEGALRAEEKRAAKREQREKEELQQAKKRERELIAGLARAQKGEQRLSEQMEQEKREQEAELRKQAQERAELDAHFRQQIDEKAKQKEEQRKQQEQRSTRPWKRHPNKEAAKEAMAQSKAEHDKRRSDDPSRQVALLKQQALRRAAAKAEKAKAATKKTANRKAGQRKASATGAKKIRKTSTA